MVATLSKTNTASTNANFCTRVDSYARFYIEYRLHLFPVTDLQLARYQQYLSYSLTAAESVGNYVFGVNNLARITGHTIPEQLYLSVSMAKAVKRFFLALQVKQAAPMTPEVPKRISKIVDYQDQVQLVSWAAILLRFIIFLSASNLVPDSMESFDPEKQFTRDSFSMALGIMMAQYSRAKNIQYKQRINRVPIIAFQEPTICPVYWLNYMIKQIPAGPKDPAFSLKIGGKIKALSYAQIMRRLKNWLE